MFSIESSFRMDFLFSVSWKTILCTSGVSKVGTKSKWHNLQMRCQRRTKWLRRSAERSFDLSRESFAFRNKLFIYVDPLRDPMPKFSGSGSDLREVFFNLVILLVNPHTKHHPLYEWNELMTDVRFLHNETRTYNRTTKSFALLQAQNTWKSRDNFIWQTFFWLWWFLLNRLHSKNEYQQ